jgi:hypothetical protein
MELREKNVTKMLSTEANSLLLDPWHLISEHDLFHDRSDPLLLREKRVQEDLHIFLMSSFQFHSKTNQK